MGYSASNRMATLELSPLAEHIDDADIERLRAALSEIQAGQLDLDDDAEVVLLERDLDDILVAEVLDRLDVSDAASDIYVPAEFEDTIEIAGMRFGSTNTLLLALDDLKEELVIDEDDEEPADGEYEIDEFGDDSAEDPLEAPAEEGQFELKEQQLHHIWRLLYSGANASINNRVCLVIKQ